MPADRVCVMHLLGDRPIGNPTRYLTEHGAVWLIASYLATVANHYMIHRHGRVLSCSICLLCTSEFMTSYLSLLHSA